MYTYHVSPTALIPGTILKPYSQRFVNNGLLDTAKLAYESSIDILKNMYLTDIWISIRTNQHPMFSMIFNEIVFEEIRKEIFSDTQSRFNSCFCSESLELAKEFNRLYRNNTGFIYYCSTLEKTIIKADMALINPGINLQDDFGKELNLLKDRAKKYWTASDTMQMPELLIQGNVQVINLVKFE